MDIVVFADCSDAGFAKAFWDYITLGRYNVYAERGKDDARYYRFILPNLRKGGPFPEMIELFARHPNFQLANELSEITPLPFNGDVSSLSAIILDDDYYEFIRSGVIFVQGIPILDVLHIIPLKMRAHVDLNGRHGQGEHVNERDLRKHRNDVVDLSDLLPGDAKLVLGDKMAKDAARFLEEAEVYAAKLTRAKDQRRILETVKALKRVYL